MIQLQGETLMYGTEKKKVNTTTVLILFLFSFFKLFICLLISLLFWFVDLISNIQFDQIFIVNNSKVAQDLSLLFIFRTPSIFKLEFPQDYSFFLFYQVIDVHFYSVKFNSEV